MLKLTDEQKALFKESGHFPGYIFTFSNIGLTITNEEIHDQAVTVKESIMDASELTLGGCIASSIEFEVSEIMDKDIAGQEFTAEIEVTDKDDNVELESLPMGTYVVSGVQLSDNRDYKKVTAYDKLSTASVDVTEWYNDWFSVSSDGEKTKHTVKETRESLLAYLEIPFENQNLTNDDYVCEKTVDTTGIKGLDILKMLCVINGGFGKMNRNGRFEVVNIGESVENSDIGNTSNPPPDNGTVALVDAELLYDFLHNNSPTKVLREWEVTGDTSRALTASGSSYPVYAKLDNGEAAIMSDAHTIKISGATDGWKATDLFRDLTSVTEIDVSAFDFSSLSYCGIFYNTPLLNTLKLDGANFSGISNSDGMFYNTGLSEIDLSGIDLSDVTSAGVMFNSCQNLTTIYANDETLQGVPKTNMVFIDCPKLVGGNGTTFGAHDDKNIGYTATYARIDKDGEPGYFTFKDSPEPGSKVTIEDYRSLKPEEFTSQSITGVTIKGTTTEDIGVSIGSTENPYVISANIFFYNNLTSSPNLCDDAELAWNASSDWTYEADQENHGIIAHAAANETDGIELLNFSDAQYKYWEYADTGGFSIAMDVKVARADGSTENLIGQINLGFAGNEEAVTVNNKKYVHVVYQIPPNGVFRAQLSRSEATDLYISNIMILTDADAETITDYREYDRSADNLMEAATGILSELRKIKAYRPYTASIDGLPYIETGDPFFILRDSDEGETGENAVDSYVFERTLSGVASLQDSYEAKGTQERKNEASATDETYRTAGKEFKFVTGPDGLTAQMTNFETKVETQFGVYDGQIVMKVDADGNMALVELTGDPKDGTEFKVEADNISMTATEFINFMTEGDINLTGKHITITSDHFNVTEAGEVEASALTIKGGRFDVQTSTAGTNILTLVGVSGLSDVYIYTGGRMDFKYAGEGAPDDVMGNDGEFYLDISEVDGLAYRKYNGSWNAFTAGEIVGDVENVFITELKIDTENGFTHRNYNYEWYIGEWRKSENYIGAGMSGINFSKTARTGGSSAIVTHNANLNVEIERFTGTTYDDFDIRLTSNTPMKAPKFEIGDEWTETTDGRTIYHDAPNVTSDNGVISVNDGTIGHIDVADADIETASVDNLLVGNLHRKMHFLSFFVAIAGTESFIDVSVDNLDPYMPVYGNEASGTIVEVVSTSIVYETIHDEDGKVTETIPKIRLNITNKAGYSGNVYFSVMCFVKFYRNQ